MSDDKAKPECGWVKLFTAQGVQVTLPVTAVPLDYRAMLANVGAMLEAGFLVSAPGVEAGEHKDEIGFVVRREKSNDDHSTTPVIDLYPADDVLKFALVSVYLNTPEQVVAFEYAAKVKLDNLPVYVGDNKIERGKKPATDRFVVKTPKPFGVIWKDNPKYDPNEQDTAKKKAKRLFVRWADARPAAPAPATAAATNAPQESFPESSANPGRRAAIAQKFATCKTEADAKAVCDLIVADSRAGLLSQEDRDALRDIARSTLGRCHGVGV